MPDALVLVSAQGFELWTYTRISYDLHCRQVDGPIYSRCFRPVLFLILRIDVVNPDYLATIVDQSIWV